ncbi:hypothetical protein DBR42_13900 [Pelomonas sp. HMWF004]|nr:hypothetical protein DBR42_13900 [Pelomonas sp. HMWF004]
MDQPKRGRGRPPKPPEERMEQRSIRLSLAHWAKIDANGGIDWLRGVIERAKAAIKPPADKA